MNLIESANLPENDSLREERRLCYVAITRAKDRLVLSSASDYDSSVSNEQSRFIVEAVGDTEVTKLDGSASGDPLKRIEANQPELALAGVYAPPEPLELSYTQIATYLECPLKYYWEHVEHVYVEPDPATEYGKLLHEVIAILNRAHQHGENLGEAELKKLIDQSWQSKRWLFVSKEHLEQARGNAEEALLKYWKIESDRAPAAYVEEEFRMTVGGVIIKGRFDRIDKNGERFTLTDYKSSEAPTQRIAERKLTSNHQLTLYAMALKERFGTDPAQMTLHFLESGRTASTRVTKAKVKNMEERIAKVAAGIKDRDFTPKKTQHYCTPTIFNFCPGNKLPPVRER